MSPDPTDSIERLSHLDLIRVVRDLVGEVGERNADQRVGQASDRASDGQRRARAAEEVPPRPPIKPSGMEKATQQAAGSQTEGEKGSRSGKQM
jgi:hypothetical protein